MVHPVQVTGFNLCFLYPKDMYITLKETGKNLYLCWNFATL